MAITAFQSTINRTHFDTNKVRVIDTVKNLLDSAYYHKLLEVVYGKNAATITVAGNIKNETLQANIIKLAKENKFTVKQDGQFLTIKVKR